MHVNLPASAHCTGALRPGFRVFEMRSRLGTKIELCQLLVRIHPMGEEPHDRHRLAALERQVVSQTSRIEKSRR